MAKAPAELPCILVDTREQLCLHFSPLVTSERASLPTGDYSIRGYTDRVAWERKSLADLVMSCTKERERFDDCLRRLRDYEHKAIIVEATREDVWAQVYRSRAVPQSIIGSTRAFLADYGIPTIWCGNARGAANEIEWWALRICGKKLRGVTGDGGYPVNGLGPPGRQSLAAESSLEAPGPTLTKKGAA